jgi:hypothetical protein
MPLHVARDLDADMRPCLWCAFDLEGSAQVDDALLENDRSSNDT